MEIQGSYEGVPEDLFSPEKDLHNLWTAKTAKRSIRPPQLLLNLLIFYFSRLSLFPQPTHFPFPRLNLPNCRYTLRYKECRGSFQSFDFLSWQSLADCIRLLYTTEKGEGRKWSRYGKITIFLEHPVAPWNYYFQTYTRNRHVAIHKCIEVQYFP